MSKNIDMSYDIKNGKVSMDYDKVEIVLNNGQQFFAKTTVDPDVIYEVSKGY